MNLDKRSPNRSAQKCSTLVRRPIATAVLLATVWFATATLGAEPRAVVDPHRVAVDRAIAYLNQEISAWNKGHTCYSCHNSGDAIRALLVAEQNGHSVDSTELQKTVAWLRHPREWSRNGPDGEFNDRRLARLQFASALAAAERKRESADRPLRVAAEMLADDLRPDGSWPNEQIGTIGSPITYGPFLATTLASNVISQTDRKRFSGELARTTRWLRSAQPKSVLNAAAVLWAIADDTHPDAASQRKRCLQLIRGGRSEDGGWGPYVNSATEPFDTAVVLLALQAVGDEDLAELIEAGRNFLIASQWSDGSWPETTRPADRESYAHRVSTAAWCLQALVN